MQCTRAVNSACAAAPVPSRCCANRAAWLQVHSTEKKLLARNKELTDARVAQQQLQTTLDAARAQQGAIASQVRRLLRPSVRC